MLNLAIETDFFWVFYNIWFQWLLKTFCKTITVLKDFCWPNSISGHSIRMFHYQPTSTVDAFLLYRLERVRRVSPKQDLHWNKRLICKIWIWLRIPRKNWSLVCSISVKEYPLPSKEHVIRQDMNTSDCRYHRGIDRYCPKIHMAVQMVKLYTIQHNGNARWPTEIQWMMIQQQISTKRLHSTRKIWVMESGLWY